MNSSRNERRGCFSIYFMSVKKIPYQNLKRILQNNEIYRPICLMSINTKILPKIVKENSAIYKKDNAS